MFLVRLLLRRGDQVFCVPRADTGRLDLPTRACATDDLDGTTAIRSLAGEVVGSDSDLDFLGSVRNVVALPDANYHWPTPVAHFGVWESLHPPVAEGVWVDVTEPGSILRDRHRAVAFGDDGLGDVGRELEAQAQSLADRDDVQSRKSIGDADA